MNLLVTKKRVIRNSLKLSFILLHLFFLSCNEEIDLGIKYKLDENGANVKFIEFVLPATNIFLDSLRTDGEDRVLIGNYSDPLTGSVEAEGYFQFLYEKGELPRAKETTTTTSSDTLKVDSVIVIFETASSIPEIDPSFQDFRLYELQNNLVSNLVYLSNLQQPTETEIGSFSRTINGATDNIYRFKLTNDYAQSFYNELSDIAGDSDKNIVTATFKSLGIIPGPLSERISSINLLSDTARMIVYSSSINPQVNNRYLTYFRFFGKNYTYLNRDRTSSSFSGILPNQDISILNRDFDLPSGKTIIDPLSGINTAYSIDSIANFFKQNRNILINSAVIAFEFEDESNRDTLIDFTNYFRRADNSINGGGQSSDPFGSIILIDDAYLSLFAATVSRGFLNTNKDEILLPGTFFYDQLYREFLKGDSLAFLVPTSNALIPIDEFVTLTSVNVTLQRTIFKKDGIKLRLFYTEIGN